MHELGESEIQFPFMNILASNKGLEFNNHKIVPTKEKILLKRNHHDNEWQQEYFIIYNSYVIEDKISKD